MREGNFEWHFGTQSYQKSFGRRESRRNIQKYIVQMNKNQISLSILMNTKLIHRTTRVESQPQTVPRLTTAFQMLTANIARSRKRKPTMHTPQFYQDVSWERRTCLPCAFLIDSRRCSQNRCLDLCRSLQSAILACRSSIESLRSIVAFESQLHLRMQILIF